MNADRLHAYVDAAYRVAQAMTLDARAAARLVEHAFARAQADDPDAWPDDEVRERLIRHVIDAHAATHVEGGNELLAPPPTPLRRSGTGDFQALVARELVDRLLPTALALIPDQHRTLLMLIETEHLSISDASRIFGTEASRLQQDREEGRDLLRQAMLRTASEAEREVLVQHLGDDWLRNGLQRYARSRFGPPPPTLVLPSPPTDAADTPGSPPRTPRSAPGPEVRQSFARRLVQAVALVFVAGLLAYVASALLEKEPETDVVTLSAAHMSTVEVDLPSNSASEIESFLLEETQWRVRLPEIDDAVLLGVAMVEIVGGVEIPVILYRDAQDGSTLPVFVYSYALLDRYEDRIRLERDVMQQIQDERHFDLHDLGDARVLIWRSRDDIFVAATSGDASTLQDRIRPAL